ncbi:MAG TPA: aminotransferase class I/II-fold pyridoxal phosphate-dependent enzyme [Pseudonocardiaceae bacterium]|nr:aminotransferase class I/II-fold pyridoxal phosphate-dependent enzyme [Pseudonocardiaceae bacterium]
MTAHPVTEHPVTEHPVTAMPGRRAATIPGSGIRAVAAAAWARPGTVHLEFGEPAYDTEPHIIDAADRAARAGHTHYGPTAGLPEFRAAVATKLVRDNGWTEQAADPAHVVVTGGGTGALFAAYSAILDDGDEILVPDPGWPNFSAIAYSVSARPVGYPVDPATGGPPPPETLDRLKTGKTRAILVNSPSNPTGAVWTADQLAAVGEWATGNGLWVISDECYDRLGFDGPPAGMATSSPDTRTVSIFSLSKSYAMTGWRLGYAVAPPDLAAAMTRVQEAMASCVSTVGQFAGIAALLGPQDSVDTMRAAYRATRDAAVATCDQLGLDYVQPSGAFYLWLRLPDRIGDAQRLAFDLVERRGIAVAPGPAFGPAGAGHLRVSLAATSADVTAGLAAISAELEEGAR